MEFDVLGRLVARNGASEVTLGSSKQRSLLALLLIHANEVVSTDRIIDELWGDDATDRQNALWVHVSGLRSALEPDRERRSEGSLLLTRSPGYVLEIAPDDLDAWSFEAAVARGRAVLESDPESAAQAAGDGLSLWRGRPYDDVGYESFAQAEIARLEELRLEAVELRIEADLRRGRAAELVGELEGLVRLHPLRETMTGQLMVALYRSGRQADALRAYARLQRSLAEEIGLPPSAGLRRLEERIVLGDPSLDHRGGPHEPQQRLAIRGYELRDHLGDGETGRVYRAYQPAVGREVAIKVVRPELANDPAFIRRFEAEAELVARLEHPGVVPLYDYWREPDAAYLVTRLFRGGSLADLVSRSPLEPAAAASVVRDVGGAVAAAHRVGVVHRDIKPSNILIDHEGRAYLGDFEILPEDGPVTGTRSPYASPEQLAGGPGGPASDIYSLGLVARFALTGAPPGGVEPDTELSPAVTEAIDRATRPEPDARFATVDDFVDACWHRASRVPRRRRRSPSGPSSIPTRDFGRSRSPTLRTSSVGSGWSTGSSLGWASPVRVAGSWPWWGRAAAGSRARSRPACCRRSAAVRAPTRPTGSSST
jgi:DNA-binding SARP family transcriptional activator